MLQASKNLDIIQSLNVILKHKLSYIFFFLLKHYILKLVFISWVVNQEQLVGFVFCRRQVPLLTVFLAEEGLVC